jgi:hypothetical protein
MLHASVIICGHNPRPDYLTQVLAGLRTQTLEPQCWELLLIDNGSETPLKPNWDLSWHLNARHVREPSLGLAYARQRGMREAGSDLLVFVDDDNVLDPNYLLEATRIGREWPILGAWGSGAIILEYERPPAKHLEKWCGQREAKRTYWSNVPFSTEATPWGSGLCVRAKVAAEYCRRYGESWITISDRLGTMQLGGGDTEICLVACDMGLGTAVFPQLRLLHLIPKERVTPEFLLRTLEGNAVSGTLLAHKWGRASRSPLSVRGLIAMCRAVALNRGFERRAHFAAWRGAIKAKRLIEGAELKTR